MDETIKGSQIAFVTGGSGFVGGRLIRGLVAQGFQVRALARSRSSIAVVENLGAVPVEGELNDREALRKGVSGSDVVFHVAAMFKLWGDRKEFDAVNVDGMRALVDHCAHRQGQEGAWLCAPCYLERWHRGDDDDILASSEGGLSLAAC
jgi:nucleoside-diphosphate-sugar epimerase